MPRGVYDRSKMKKVASSDASAEKPKRKYTRRNAEGSAPAVAAAPVETGNGLSLVEIERALSAFLPLRGSGAVPDKIVHKLLKAYEEKLDASLGTGANQVISNLPLPEKFVTPAPPATTPSA